VTRAAAGRVWRNVAQKVELPPGADGWHALRHYYASVLIRAGESVRVVQERLGHSSATVTLDVYSHLWPEDAESTRTAVQDALSALSSAPVAPRPADISRTSGGQPD
jgi:integrase